MSMREVFFAIWPEVPEGSGFLLYGPEHLFFLALSVISCAALRAVYLRAGAGGRKRLLYAVASAMLAMEAAKSALLIAKGRWDPSWLPLHLCSWAMYADALYAFLPERYAAARRAAGELSFLVLLPGAASALLFPVWTDYPLFSYISLHSIVWHILACAFPVMLFSAGEVRPALRGVLRSLLLLIACALFTALLNRRMGTNFLFLSEPSPGSPLTAFRELFGDLWRVPYVLLVILVVLSMYALSRLFGGRRREK